MWKWVGVAIVVAAMTTMTLGCSQPSGTAVVIEDKVYTVTPAGITVKAGIVTGNVTEMKVMERVEKGSDRVVSPAKLSGKLVLKNNSTNQTVRLVAGKILYIDTQGQPIKLEATRTEPAIKFASYGAEQLNPGQEATQTLDVDFPAEALKAKKLKEIRLEFAYIPSPYKDVEAEQVTGDRLRPLLGAPGPTDLSAPRRPEEPPAHGGTGSTPRAWRSHIEEKLAWTRSTSHRPGTFSPPS